MDESTKVLARQEPSSVPQAMLLRLRPCQTHRLPVAVDHHDRRQTDSLSPLLVRSPSTRHKGDQDDHLNDIEVPHGEVTKREVPAASPITGMIVGSGEVAGAVVTGTEGGDGIGNSADFGSVSAFVPSALLTVVNLKPASPATHSLFSHKSIGVSVGVSAVWNRHSGSML